MGYMMRNVVKAFLLGAVSFAPSVAWSESLADALIAAYRNSHLLDQNQAVLRAADEDVATAVGSLLPVISFVSKVGRVQTNIPDGRTSFFSQDGFSTSGSSSLQASITLLDFGRGKTTVALKNELVLASQAALVNVEQQVLFDAVQAYVNVALQADLVATQESNVKLISQDLQATKDRFDVGEVTKTDVSLAEAQLASAKAQLASAQGNYTVAKERYNAAIGHYPDHLSALPRNPVAVKSVDEARAIALRGHPAVTQAAYQAKASDLGVDLAKAQMSPTLGLSTSLSETYDSDGLASSVGSVGVQLDQTLYAGGRLSSALRKAIAQQGEAHAGQLQTGVNVTEAVGKAWSNILVAKASIVATDEQIRAAQAAYDGVKQEAELGSRTTLDVLNAEQDLLSAKASQLQAQANLSVSQYGLLAAMGLLTADQLHLGIPTFDPAAYFNAVKKAPATSARGAKLDKILKTLGK